jgi:hypothetical protein
MRVSAGVMAVKVSNHAQAEGITRPQDGQQGNLQQTDQHTHILRVKQGHERVSRGIYSKGIRLCTC